MGVGFNSIYHITDCPSFIIDDKYVILDPHEWHFEGGIQFDFVKQKLAAEIRISLLLLEFRVIDHLKAQSLFRYPLRNSTDKIYEPEQILEMFHKFYENESINCLLFLKHIELISFYEFKEDAKELELLYTIRLENAIQVREQRQLISKNIVSMINLLNSGELYCNNHLATS